MAIRGLPSWLKHTRSVVVVLPPYHDRRTLNLLCRSTKTLSTEVPLSRKGKVKNHYQACIRATYYASISHEERWELQRISGSSKSLWLEQLRDWAYCLKRHIAHLRNLRLFLQQME